MEGWMLNTGGVGEWAVKGGWMSSEGWKGDL